MTKSEGVRKAKERRRRGKLLRDAIEKAGLTQREFAERVRTDRSAINQMVAGNRPFGRTVAARFTKNLGLPDDYFEPPEATDAEAEGSPLMVELAEIRAALETMSTRREAFRTELARQLKSQTDLLATLTAAGVELRGLIGDLREAREATPGPSPKRRSA